MGKYRSWYVVAAAVVISAGLAGLFWWQYRGGHGPTGAGPGAPTGPAAPDPGGPVAVVTLDHATLTATSFDRAGVAADSAFVLTADRPLERRQLEQALRVEPAVPLTYTPETADGTRWRIDPQQPLAAGRVYGFTLAAAGPERPPFRWAFQTQAPFRVVGSTPGTRTFYVPVDTGIEFRLSHAGVREPERYFSIEPDVPGRFEQQQRTLVFLPDAPLAPGTIYRVTLKAGLPLADSAATLAEDYEITFETAPVDASPKDTGDLWVQDDLLEFPTGDAPALMVGYHRPGGGEPPPVQVQVWRYPDAAAFIGALTDLDAVPGWAWYRRQTHWEEPGALPEAAQFTAPLETSSGYSYLLFPAPLPAGYYLAELRAGDTARQVRFQVTDLSAYVAATETDTLVWVNDLATGRPAADVAVAVPAANGGTDFRGAATGADGVATFPTPARLREAPPEGEETRLYLRLSDAAGREAVLPVAGASWYAARAEGAFDQRDYWQYLYTDRGLYRPGDNVHFWGVAIPRTPGAPVPDRVEVALRATGGYGPGYRLPDDDAVAVTVPVQDGTFSGQLPLPALRPGGYQLTVRMGEVILAVRWLQVEEYTKPAYQVTLGADRRAVFAGDPVTFAVAARFFEGTPVAGLALRYHSYGTEGDGASGEVRTDARGEAQVTVTAGPPYEYSTSADLYFNAHSAFPEAGEIMAEHRVQVFAGAVHLAADGAYEDGEATVTVTARQVVLDALNAGAAAGPEAWLGDPVRGQTVSGTIHKVEWVPIPMGTYYDFIAKRVQQRYDYRREERPAGEFRLETGADGRAAWRFAAEPDSEYVVRLHTADGDGRSVALQHYLYTGSRLTGPSFYWRWFGLRPVAEGRAGYAIGEDAAFEMVESEVPLPARPDGFLFYTARRGLGRTWVQDSSRLTYRLQETDVPNTNLRAVHFDGRVYREARELAVRYDPAERALDITVTPDRAEYRPGDEVRLAVTVRDARGRPVAATVNLNLVDEALYALAPEEVDLLASLYNHLVPSGVFSTFASHPVPEVQGGAEKGGEGGALRKDFRDAIFFRSVTTGPDGRAEASFRVPDNLTSWRVTYQGITGDLQAGSGTVAVPVRLPFFVEPVVGDTYLTGDEPVVTLRAYGTAVSGGGKVEYRVTLRPAAAGDPGGEAGAGAGGEAVERTAAGDALSPVQVALPPLARGRYTLTVHAAGPGGLTDAVERSFTVTDTYLERPQVTHHVLTPGLTFRGDERGLTRITLTAGRRADYLAALQQLQWQWGHRVEQRLAADLARAWLREHFPPGPDGGGAAANGGDDPDDDWTAAAYQLPHGGIAPLPYSDADLRLSALVAGVAPERFDRQALAAYLLDVLDQAVLSRSEAAMALYGLAALGEPVLAAVQEALADPDLAAAERLWLSLAAAALGDGERARAAVGAVLAQHGEALGNTLRLTVAGDPAETALLTALAAAGAAAVGAPETPALFRAAVAAPPARELNLLELLLVLRAELPRSDAASVRVVYERGGAQQEVTVTATRPVTLQLTPADLAGFRIVSVSGEAAATVGYTAPFSLPADTQPRGRLSRSYSVVGAAGGAGDGAADADLAWRPGDLIRVTLRYDTGPDAAPGSHLVTDFLPAGLRLVQAPWRYGHKDDQRLAWPAAVDRQRATFVLWEASGEVVYYARVVTPGRYSADAAVLQHGKSGELWAWSDRQTVTVR